MKSACSLFIFSILLSSKLIFCQTISSQKIDERLNKAISFLDENQVKKTEPNKTFFGEWPSYMHMSNPYFLLGKAQKYRDSNCFSMTGIFNALAEGYQYDTTQYALKTILKNGFQELLSYRQNEKFNFWKSLPANRNLSIKERKDTLIYVRRPTHYKLKSRFINNAANIAFDADDTSMGNLAIFYHNKIFSDTSINYVSPALFDNYLDKDRHNYHWHNYLVRIPRKSGAYLTWLEQEDYFKRWTFLKAVANNLVFFLPLSSAFPTPYKPYVPWGANDLDAVVNANVLTYLATTNQLVNAKGKEGANVLISHQIKRQRWSRAGMYYPNRYHFHYAATRAIVAGNKDLNKENSALLNYLLKTQKNDGHFESRRKVHNRDYIQSTVYATLSLLNLKESGENIPKEIIEKSIFYLLSHQKSNGSWSGGVFFSGGTVVRNVLYFQSDSYTTALMVLALNKYKKMYK